MFGITLLPPSHSFSSSSSPLVVVLTDLRESLLTLPSLLSAKRSAPLWEQFDIWMEFDIWEQLDILCWTTIVFSDTEACLVSSLMLGNDRYGGAEGAGGEVQ